EQNLEFARYYSDNHKDMLIDLVQQLDCQHLLHKHPAQLSGGELQRVAYIRALIQIKGNHIILLDEPYSALDKKLANTSLHLLHQFKNNNLIFLVTHNISELYQIADELLYIDKSEVILHQSIEAAMSSGYNRLPIASRINIADKIHMDISTISRVANSKYVDTPYGTKLIKEFFSESMKNDKGEDISTRKIKNILQTIIDNENKQKPVTDEKLSLLLKEKGYLIARRTVAKYREQLNIPVARLRKVIL
ncbi:MAG: RNA polymerase sigma-54 factor, partial [Flavobacteriaceae bacterium]|nr:RNA polymerase sigma-54 factor [Flavobacteriaceae bacterium]